MGCIESRIKKSIADHNDNNERDVSLKDMIALRQASLSSQYDVELTPLAHGSRGEVRKAVHKATNQVRAVKVIPRKDLDAEKFFKECNILRNLDHFHITRTYETYQDLQNFYIVTELITGEDLFGKITSKGAISESFAAKTMKEILSAVNYMHKCGVIHRNLKPESLRFADESEDAPIKITNFALAELFRLDDPKKEFVGTVEYVAPEMIEGLYNTSVDVWACGVILYIMLSGTPPFTGSTPDQIMKSIKEDQIKFEGEVWKEISAEAKDLISKMLAKEVGLRPTAEQALDHEWFKKNVGQTKMDLKSSKTIVNNLKKYKIQKKIQQAVWMFMVHYVARKEDKEKMLKEFKALDTDNDGRLSKEELVSGLKKSVSFFDYSKTVETAFETMDKSRSSFIEYTEFIAAMMDRKALLSKQNLESAFALLDKDSSGSISVQEMKDAFGGEQILLDDEYWRKLIAEGDTNQDGQIDFQEFYKLMSEIKN